MSDAKPEETTPIDNLRRTRIMSREVLHFTGGLVAFPVVGGGVAIGPIRVETGLGYVGPMSFKKASELAMEMGSFFVGANQIHDTGPERSEFWKPNLGGGNFEQTSESWASIAISARKANDEIFANAARYLCLSIRAAAWRLRDVSRFHNEQLEWALLSEKKSGARFSNVPLFDLYLAVHSLVTELCAARDYLAQICALRVGAKQGTDSLARLMDWLSKASHSHARIDAMAALLLSANGNRDSPGWLADLGELRNRLVHREPMAANPDAAALLFVRPDHHERKLGNIRLSKFREGKDVVDGEDPFVSLLRFWLSFEALSRACWPLVDYSAVHPTFSVE